MRRSSSLGKSVVFNLRKGEYKGRDIDELLKDFNQKDVLVLLVGEKNESHKGILRRTIGEGYLVHTLSSPLKLTQIIFNRGYEKVEVRLVK